MGVNWKGLIGGVAPAIVKALGAGGGPASAAVAILSKALLGNDKGSESEVAAAIQAGLSPEQAVKVQEAERDFAVKMVELNISMTRLEVDDRANARAMQAATRSKTPTIITYAIIVLYAAAFVALCNVPIPKENAAQVNSMVDSLKMLITTTFGYWLGGSFGSYIKTVAGR